MVAVLEGDWKAGSELCRRAEAIFVERCGDARWVGAESIWSELDYCNVFKCLSLFYMGQIAELGRLCPGLIDEARDRDDVFELANLTNPVMTLVRLAADEPEEARRESARAIERWSRSGFHIQHHHALRSQAFIDLYCSDGASAWERLSGSRVVYQRSLLRRFQYIRIELWETRARCALAAAAQAANPAPLLRAAEADARRLRREKLPWAAALSDLVRAGCAACSGDTGSVSASLNATVLRLDALDMQLYAAAARYRLGELLGGQEGRALVSEATLWMTGQGIRHPDRFAAVYAPGFPGRERP
jgi:hypothetical protein